MLPTQEQSLSATPSYHMLYGNDSFPSSTMIKANASASSLSKLPATQALDLNGIPTPNARHVRHKSLPDPALALLSLGRTTSNSTDIMSFPSIEFPSRRIFQRRSMDTALQVSSPKQASLGPSGNNIKSFPSIEFPSRRVFRRSTMDNAMQLPPKQTSLKRRSVGRKHSFPRLSRSKPIASSMDLMDRGCTPQFVDAAADGPLPITVNAL